MFHVKWLKQVLYIYFYLTTLGLKTSLSAVSFLLWHPTAITSTGSPLHVTLIVYLPQTDFPGCVVGGLLRLDLPYGLVTGASRTCTPIFGTPCRVWRAPSQLDSSWPAVPRGTGTPAPPMSPRRCHWWDYTPVEQTEAGTPWAWDVAVQFQTSNRVLQSKRALLALWFQNSVCNRLCTGE